MKIYIGADHAGYNLKERIKDYLSSKNIDFEDLGTDSIDPVDYPDIAKKVSEKVIENSSEGILICGAANGIAIAANKVKGVRAAIGFSKAAAKSARADNNANVIVFGERVQKSDEVIAILDEWFENKFFDVDRHKRRIEKIKIIEENG